MVKGKPVVDVQTSAIMELTTRLRGTVQEVLVRQYFDKTLPPDSIYCVAVACLRTIGETLAGATNPDDAADLMRFLEENAVGVIDHSMAAASRVHHGPAGPAIPGAANGPH